QHAVQLAPLALGPVLLAAIVSYITFRYPLAQHEWFLIFVAVFVAEAWLLNSAFMFTFEKLNPALPRKGQLAIRALHLLPKVLLSFTVVTALFVASGFFPILVILSLAFVWAPFFVAGETFGKEIVKDPDADEGYDADDEAFGAPKEEFSFSSQSLWQIGLGRSFVFSVTNISLTLELVILFSIVKIGPVALLTLLKGDASSAVFPVIDGALPTFLSTFLLSAMTYLFLLHLPRAAREELSLPRFTEEEQMLRRNQKPHPLIIMVGVPLSILAYWVVLREVQREGVIPPAAQLTVESIRRDGDTLIWKVRLEDSQRQFRWLDTEDFLLVASPKAEKTVAPVSDESREERRTQTLREFTPDRAYVFGADGKLIEQSYRPSYDPLVVELRFMLPGVLVRELQSAELRYGAEAGTARTIGDVQLAELKDGEQKVEKNVQ
ncbi:MAG: hypothetical protein IT290_12375, partial [Deltaproteobacteria bacterium]|nr:hypothetical protein [Deltaproteobacteria bacterium]